MKELFEHIERLLTGHDCVVVPGLGGFVLHEVHFSVGEDGSIFRPGGKDISFNVRLTFNDGILVQSYQETYQLTFEAAVETIRERVAAIHTALNEGHVIPVGRLGTLRKNDDGKILFRPDNRNLFCPECYGLTSFVYQTLDQRAQHIQEKSRKKKRRNNQGKDAFIHIRSRRHTFSQVLTGIAACLLFLLIAKPAGELKQFKTQEAFLLREYFMSGITTSTLDTLTLSGVPPLHSESTHLVTTKRTSRKRSGKVQSTDDIDSLFGTTSSKSDTKKSKRLLPSTDDIDSLFGLISFIASGGGSTKKTDTTKSKQTSPSIEDTALQNNAKSRTPKEVTPKSNTTPQNSLPKKRNATAQTGGKTYNIIISSHPSKAVASKWLSKRSDDLYEQATIIEGDGRARVSIKRFDNKQEAENFLRQFRTENPGHADAWLLPTAI